MKNQRRALVTLTLGQTYRERWSRYARPGWELYAERHGYDLICLDRPLDESDRAQSRSPAWQKCLVLNQPFARNYERIVWLDADILINPAAPDICAGVPLELVGAVDEFAAPTPELQRLLRARLVPFWEASEAGWPFARYDTPEEYYTTYGFPHGFPHIVQTGALALSPQHHRDILERTYAAYEDRGRYWAYEMRPLSYELLRARCVHWIDARFNLIWGVYQAIYCPYLFLNANHPTARDCLAEALARVYFLHFAGGADAMKLVPKELPRMVEKPIEQSTTQSTTQPTAKPIDGMPAPLETPVALFIFNRPDTTAQVFAAVAAARPTCLLIVADGPRPERDGEAERCAAARAVVEQVDWPCEVSTNYADTNMGLKRRVESGLTWVFEQVEEAIILEDDCLPHPVFFRYCAELLERYRHDERIFVISGTNNLFGRHKLDHSYYFSRYPHIWGWATWRRAWAHYDGEFTQLPRLLEEGWFARFLGNRVAGNYWAHTFQQTALRRDSWDYAWALSCWLNDALCISPAVNLVSNLGFGAGATHTRNADSLFANMPTQPMTFPLRHPPQVVRDAEADDLVESVMFSGWISSVMSNFHQRIKAARESTHIQD